MNVMNEADFTNGSEEGVARDPVKEATIIGRLRNHGWAKGALAPMVIDHICLQSAGRIVFHARVVLPYANISNRKGSLGILGVKISVYPEKVRIADFMFPSFFIFHP